MAHVTGPERAPKRIKLLSDDDDSSDSSSDASGGVPVAAPAELTINKEYAQRFEHNSRRAELQRLEEKYGKKTGGPRPSKNAELDDDESDGSSSTSTDEDEEGMLASAVLDNEFNATLQAIRNKDPRVYNTNTTFYTEAEPDGASEPSEREKPMYLHDYHRENLLRGDKNPETADPELTYVEQQQQLKQAVLKEMHDVAADADSASDDDEFLVAKEQPIQSEPQSQGQSGITAIEIENANADPDAYLSKFLSSRAWIPSEGRDLHPFESDDEEEDDRAEAIEEAYNFRFEDPSKANDKLVSHARDVIEKYTVRKEAPSKRQRARETEKERKLADKEERKAEKARLRKLRVEEAQMKLTRIKDAAGATSSELKLDDWQDLLAGDWDEDQWEEEMQKKFNEAYYAENSDSGSDDEKIGKMRKPKWEDDIDIKDLVPEFDSGEADKFSLSGDEPEDRSEAQDEPPLDKKRSKKKDKLAAKSERRREQRQLEQFVDAKLDRDIALEGNSSKVAGPTFRYRETSPIAFGMTPKDILFAEDQQLNQFAGLKKLAAFRDAEKKRRDKKRLGKKARLREWRKETFGHERGSRQSLQDVVQAQLANGSRKDSKRLASSRKRKRSKNSEAS